MSIPDLPPAPLKWENQPSTKTPFDAEVLNPWGQQIHDIGQAARDYAQIAQQAAQDAQAPTDQAMANTVATEGSLTRAELDALYQRPEEADVEPGHDVVALIGQSNMVGRGPGIDPTSLDPTVGRVYAFGATGPHANRIVHATDPLAHWDPQPDTVGPGMEFARHYATLIPTQRTVLLVPAAHGATAFSGGAKRWKVDHTPDHENLYLLALRQTRLALEAAGTGARLAGFLWHQGEGDSTNADYAHDLDALINSLRSALDAPEAWFLVGQMSPPGNALNPGKQATNLVHIDTPRRNYRTAFAYAPWLHRPDDTTHFSAAGARALGRSYAAALPLALANTPESVPVPPSRVRQEHHTPGRVAVRWDRPACRFIDFVVEHRQVGASTWQTWAHDASLHNGAVLHGYPAGTQVEVRVATVNENGTSNYSDPATLTTTPHLDEAAGALPWRAHALRRVVAGHTGDLIRVRRSSDDTQQYIGQTPDGQLDEDALRAFVGNGHGYVTEWVNQAGGSHLSNPVPAQQPQIVRNGVVLKDNGCPVMELDGVDDHLWSSATGVYAAGGATVSMVHRTQHMADTPRLLSEGNSTADRIIWGITAPDDGHIGLQVRTPEDSAATALSPRGFLDPDRLLAMMVVDEGTSTRFRAGTRESDPESVLGGRTGQVDRFTVGAFQRTSVTHHAPMRLSELAVWTTILGRETQEAVLSAQGAWHHIDQEGGAA